MARGGARGGRAAPGGRGAALTHAASPPPAAPPQPRAVLAVSWLPRMVCQHTCTSLEDVSAIPPPARRPWRRSAPGPAPRSRRKDKRAVRSLQPGRNIHGVSTPAQEIREAKLRTRAPAKTSWAPAGAGLAAGQAGRSRQAKAKVEVSATRALLGCPAGWLGGRRVGGIRDSGSGPAAVRARGWQPLWSPGDAAAPRRHLMAKVEETTSARGSRPPVDPPPPSAGTFPKVLSRVPHGHGGGPPADVATPPGSESCTCLGCGSPFPSPGCPAASRASSSGEGEGRRRLGRLRSPRQVSEQ